MALSAPSDPNDLIVTVYAEDAHAFRDRLSEITAPTLVIDGEDDGCDPQRLAPEVPAGDAAVPHRAPGLIHPGGIGGPGVEALQRDVPKGVHALIPAKGAVPVGIEPELEMQMGACALAGTAHRADALPLLHGVPHAHAHGLKVHILLQVHIDRQELAQARHRVPQLLRTVRDRPSGKAGRTVSDCPPETVR